MTEWRLRAHYGDEVVNKLEQTTLRGSESQMSMPVARECWRCGICWGGWSDILDVARASLVMFGISEHNRISVLY